MADSTQIPLAAEATAQSAHVDGSVVEENPADVPQRPAWLPGERQSTTTKRPSSSPLRPSVVTQQQTGAIVQPKVSFQTRIAGYLRTAAAAGYGASLLLHFLLLLGMALWFFPQLKDSMSITTVVQSDTEEPQPFDAMDDIHLEAPAGSEDILVPQLTDIIQQDAELNVLEHQFLQDVTAVDTQGDGGRSDVGSGGFRLLEPKNAVKAGSFTAWTIPIPKRFGEKATAGDSPRPGQDYHIVIQVKLPANRKVYRISDLSGRVIGTDGYRQPIPAQAYIQDEDGRLFRTRGGGRVPIVEGVVQILIRVPGASALVKDTINIKSKLLKEHQTLELIFGKRP